MEANADYFEAKRKRIREKYLDNSPASRVIVSKRGSVSRKPARSGFSFISFAKSPVGRLMLAEVKVLPVLRPTACGPAPSPLINALVDPERETMAQNTFDKIRSAEKPKTRK